MIILQTTIDLFTKKMKFNKLEDIKLSIIIDHAMHQ